MEVKNYIVYRYAETLLMYAEAVIQGASPSAMSGRSGSEPG